MRLETLCFLAGLENLPSTRMAACEISAITIDSRAVVPGCMFVCITGTKADGHAFIEEALQKGAAAVVIEREVPVMKTSGAVFIRVSNSRRALARLCNAWYSHPAANLKLIAVTGTNGKTSVSTMLKAMFDAAMIPCGLIGTVGCICRDRPLNIRSANREANMTTPDPNELYHMLSVMAAEGVEVVIMEATSHALALDKLEPLSFEAAVFTNLTPEHLDFHGDMEAYFEAKAKLFAKAKVSVLNADDAATPRLAQRCAGRVVRTSTGGRRVDYVATEAEFHGADGVSYTMCAPRVRAKMSSPIPGIFTLSNTLQAAACALEMGVDIRAIRQALTNFSGVAGRMERVRLGLPTDFCVFIDYAHTPDAIKNLLLTARGFCREHQRIVLLFGCGGDRDKTKRPKMAQIAGELADVVYVTSDNSRSEKREDIIADILSGLDKSKEYYVIPDRTVAIETAIRNARAGDVILLAGKGHERYEIDEKGSRPFDERAIASAAAWRQYPTSQQ